MIDTNKCNITKTQAELYKIRFENSFKWADITIDHNGNTGRISISSDYGNWANYWGAAGTSFKKFLIGLDMYYFAGKINASKWFDSEKTCKNYKRLILEGRKREDFTKQEARDMYDEIKELEYCDNAPEFGHVMLQSSILHKLFDGSPDLSTDVDPQFRMFWKEIWPFFVLHLKKEMEIE